MLNNQKLVSYANPNRYPTTYDTLYEDYAEYCEDNNLEPESYSFGFRS